MTLSAHAVKAGDVNGDGLADLLTQTDSAAIVQLGSSQTLLARAVWLGDVGDALGSALVAMDVDQDGYDDLVAAAPSHGHAEGEIVVYPGSAAGLSETPVIAGLGENNGGKLGSSAAPAGDTNGDGYADLVVGAPGEPELGAAHLYLGSAAGLTQAGVLAGDDDAPLFGALVAGAGDVDGDGYADVAVASGAAPFVVRVYRGSGVGTDAAWATELAFDAAPTAVGSAGDVDGDGFGDLFVGCASCEDGAGAVYVFLGSGSGIDTTPVTLHAAGGDGFGESVAAAEIHGDGFGDLVVGAASYADGLGRVYVFRGSPTGLDDARVAVLDPPAGASEFGMALGGAGDLDGDGDDELRVEAAGDAAVTGVYTYRGGPNGLDRSLAAVTTGIASTGPFTSGDFNADGLQDLAVGSPASMGGAGAVDAYLGCVDADVDGYCADDDCDDGDSSVPFLLYTDDDGDGFGAGSAASEGCQEEAGLVATGTDCNDRKAEINPDAQEVCDSRSTDEDCDGVSDDDDPSVTNQVSRYEDQDGDGYGAGDPVNQCDEGGAQSGGDCDDDDRDVHPDQYEACDGKDNDCDDQVDEDHDCPEAPGAPELPSTCATAPTTPAAAALLLAAALLRRRRCP